MASKRIFPPTNGSANRRCQSWIDRFVEFTENLEAPKLFRKWTAIGTIAAALEQKVWLDTGDRLYPNLYVVLVGHPGVGKTRTIMKGRALLDTLPDFHLAPTDMTKASMIDALVGSRRALPVQMNGVQTTLEFHSMTIMFDEWGTLLSSFEGDMIPTLTTFYDVTVPYEHTRRHKDTHVRIPRPQLSIIAGSTPSNLVKFVPDFAWDQGFTSRLILVFSGERNIRDDFAVVTGEIPEDLVSDLRSIFGCIGAFSWTDAWHNAVKKWREVDDERPKPTHPKLVHYNARRRAHLYKLAMVAAVDRGDSLLLDRPQFDTALGWLREIEQSMPEVFAAGAVSVDGRAMDEIEEFVARQGRPVSEHRIIRFAQNLLPAHSLVKVLYLMLAAKRLRQVGKDPITYVKNQEPD